MSAPPADAGPRVAYVRVPPVDYAGAVALAFLFAGGIYLASYLPKQPSLVPAIVLLVAAAALVAGSMAALTRSDGFAWGTFRLVAGWVLLAYTVIGGMFEFMFVRSGTRGGPLVVMTLMLVVFSLTAAMLIAFTVARYDRSGP